MEDNKPTKPTEPAEPTAPELEPPKEGASDDGKLTKEELLKTGEYVGVGKFEAEKKAREELAKQLEELTNQVKDSSTTKEELAKKLEVVQSEREKILKEAEAKIKGVALDAKLASLGAQDTNLVKTLIDTNIIAVRDDGSVEGLTDQIERIKKSHPYLFKTAVGGTATQPTVSTGADTSLADRAMKALG